MCAGAYRGAKEYRHVPTRLRLDIGQGGIQSIRRARLRRTDEGRENLAKMSASVSDGITRDAYDGETRHGDKVHG